MEDSFFPFGTFALGTLTLTLLCGCDRSSSSTKPAIVSSSATANVQVVRPHIGEISRSITLPAEIKAYQQATLYAKVAGYLKTIAVDKGDEVKAGDLLAEIEAPELLADSAKYKAELEIAELDFKRAADAQKKAPDLVVAQSVDTAKSKAA